MIAWLRTNRRLRSEVAYLQTRLKTAEGRPALVVKPGPPPASAAAAPAAEQAPPPYDVEELLRGQIAVLEQMKTTAGAVRLANEVRIWRERAGALDGRLLDAQRANESLTDEVRRWTDRAVAAEAQLKKLARSAELQLGPS